MGRNGAGASFWFEIRSNLHLFACCWGSLRGTEGSADDSDEAGTCGWVRKVVTKSKKIEFFKKLYFGQKWVEMVLGHRFSAKFDRFCIYLSVVWVCRGVRRARPTVVVRRWPAAGLIAKNRRKVETFRFFQKVVFGWGMHGNGAGVPFSRGIRSARCPRPPFLPHDAPAGVVLDLAERGGWGLSPLSPTV